MNMLKDATHGFFGFLRLKINFSKRFVAWLLIFGSLLFNAGPAFASPQLSTLDLLQSEVHPQLEQNFSWGVLALNPDKPVYKPLEQAVFSMAVLDSKGLMVCDANLSLSIYNISKPNVKQILSTKGGTIKVNPECQVKNFTSRPDFEASVKFPSTGLYALVLSATTKAGTRTITDYVQVANNVPFSIKRSGPTRVFPLASYTMTVDITANSDFQGLIEEYVPAVFKVTQAPKTPWEVAFGQSPTISTVAFDSHSFVSGNFITLNFPVSLKKGQVTRLAYSFQTPNISPQFYQFKPLTIHQADENCSELSYTEPRAWQIANDAAINLSGTVYQSEGGSNIGSGKTIKVYDNGSTLLGSTTTIAGGAWSLTNLTVSSSDIITAYIYNDATYKGNMVFVSDATTKTDIDIYGGALIVRNDTGSGITNANLSTGYVGADTSNMVYSVSGGNLTVNSNTEMHVWTGKTYSPGGVVTTQGTGSFHIASTSTSTLDTTNNVIAGDIIVGAGGVLNMNATSTINGGDITTTATATVTTTANTPTITISGTGSIGGGTNNITLYNLTTSGTGTTTITSSTTLTGNLTVGTGTVLAGSANITVGGGSVTGDGAINLTGGTFTATSTGNFGGATAWAFNKLTFGNGVTAATTTAIGAGAITANGQVNVAASQELNAGAKQWNLKATGTPLSVSGVFTASSSTVSFQTVSGTNNVMVLDYNNLDFSPASGSPSFVLGTVSNWYNSSWSYRKAITIDHTKVPGSLSNFPVLVSLGSDSNLAASASSTGADILFTSSDGTTKLSHELEQYSSSTGAIIAWINVASLSSTTDTTIYMYYGNSSASAQQDVPGTWSNSYVLVYHLSNGTVLSATDSTSNNNTGAITNATAIAGKIDGGGSFDGSTTYITATSSPFDPNATAFTASAWFNYTSGGAVRTMVAQANGTGTGRGWLAVATSINTKLGSRLGGTASQGNTSVTAGVMNYGAITKLNTSLTFYLNGASDGSVTRTVEAADGSALVGVATDGTTNFVGTLDEVRISNTDRSANWIKTEYNNQSSTTTFYSLGAQETPTVSGNTTLNVAGNFSLGGAGAATVNANTYSPTVNVTGNVTVGSGTTLSVSGTATTTIGGNLDVQGTFTHNSGIVIFDTAATSIITTSNTNLTFYDFTVTTPGKTIQFQHQSGLVPGFVFAGTVTIHGTFDNYIHLSSDQSGTQWIVNFNNPQTNIQYVSLQDSGCRLGSSLVTLDNTAQDLGNNDYCWHFPVSQGGGGYGIIDWSSLGGSGGGLFRSGGGENSDDGGGAGGGGTPQSGGGEGG